MQLRYLWIGLLLLPTLGCVPKRNIKPAQLASQTGHWDEAYRLWSELLSKYPEAVDFKIAKERAQLNASLDHLRKAVRYYERDLLDEASFEINLVLTFDPDNQSATNLVHKIKESRELEDLEANRATREQRSEMHSNLPQLTPTTWAPLNLIFVNKVVRDIYMSLGKAYGINILVDAKLREQKITIDLKSLSFIKALDTLMVLNGHFFSLVADNTIVILEDNKNNRDRYDSQIIQTFYLSNITPKDLKQHLRQLGGIKEFAENEKLNAITIKGTVEQLALASKIIADNDKAQPEVVIEIELLEVNKNSMRRLGILPVDAQGSPQFRAGIYADPTGRSDADRNRSGIRGIFPGLDSADFLTIVPALAIDFLKEQAGSKQVANPHLRVTSGETGLVRIGQSIPIAQTSFTNPQLSGSSNGNNNFGDTALTTFNYNDVGIKIQATPRVHYNGEISLELEVEVSSVVSSGPQPILGKREVKTMIRLKDGETNVMAGLLSNDERKSVLGIPGLSSIPILGKLFSNDEKVISQTDIIMTTRPIVIRGPNITRKDRAPYELSGLRLSSLFSNPDEQNTQPPTAPQASNIQLRGKATSDKEDQALEIEDDPETETGPIPAMLAFTPTTMEGRLGDLLEAQLFITNVAGLQRAEIVLEFDPQVLQAVRVDNGDFTGTKGNRPLVTTNWDNSSGRLTLIMKQRLGGEPLSGSGTLANLSFECTEPGSGELNFTRIDLINSEKQEIPAEGLHASYEVAP